MQRGRQLVAVFEDRQAAQRAAGALRNAVPDPGLIRIDHREDQVRALRGEMRQETGNVVGAGPIPSFTPEMAKGIVPFVMIAALLGALLAAPISAIEMGDYPFWARLLICCTVGALAGAVFGFVAGGRRGARSSSGDLAAEVGVTLGVPAEGDEIVEIERILTGCGPMRLDVFEGEQPVATVASEHRSGVGGTVDEMAEKVRHPLEPDWREDGHSPV